MGGGRVEVGVMGAVGRGVGGGVFTMGGGGMRVFLIRREGWLGGWIACRRREGRSSGLLLGSRWRG